MQPISISLLQFGANWPIHPLSPHHLHCKLWPNQNILHFSTVGYCLPLLSFTWCQNFHRPVVFYQYFQWWLRSACICVSIPGSVVSKSLVFSTFPVARVSRRVWAVWVNYGWKCCWEQGRYYTPYHHFLLRKRFVMASKGIKSYTIFIVFVCRPIFIQKAETCPVL